MLEFLKRNGDVDENLRRDKFWDVYVRTQFLSGKKKKKSWCALRAQVTLNTARADWASNGGRHPDFFFFFFLFFPILTYTWRAKTKKKKKKNLN